MFKLMIWSLEVLKSLENTAISLKGVVIVFVIAVNYLNTSCTKVVFIHGGSTAHLTNVRAVLGGNKSRS